MWGGRAPVLHRSGRRICLSGPWITWRRACFASHTRSLARPLLTVGDATPAGQQPIGLGKERRR
jgi:hypothetical protein